MPKVFTSKKQKIGKLGESLAIRYLQKNGHRIIGENMTYKYGEIDILTIDKENRVHFVEVKSSKRGINSHENYFRPEENMSPQKATKMKRTIENILSFRENVLYEFYEREVGKSIDKRELSWQVDLAIVHLDIENKKAKVSMIWNIVL